MGIVERKQRERQLRRDQIMDAARALFIENGLASSTMQDIADRAELGRRTLYLYFKTKDEILTGIALEIIRSVNRLVSEASERGGSGRERMRNVAHSFVEYYKSRPQDFLLILNADYRRTYSKEEQREGMSIDAFKESLTLLLTEILDLGLRDGSLVPSGASTRLTSETMITSIMGSMKMLAQFPRESRERGELLIHLISLLTKSMIPVGED